MNRRLTEQERENLGRLGAEVGGRVGAAIKRALDLDSSTTKGGRRRNGGANPLSIWCTIEIRRRLSRSKSKGKIFRELHKEMQRVFVRPPVLKTLQNLHSEAVGWMKHDPALRAEISNFVKEIVDSANPARCFLPQHLAPNGKGGFVSLSLRRTELNRSSPVNIRGASGVPLLLEVSLK